VSLRSRYGRDPYMKSLSNLMKYEKQTGTMQALGEIMQLLDAHSDAMPEGDYLRACGLMKEVFDRMSRPAPAPQRQRVVSREVEIPMELKERYRVNWRSFCRVRDDLKKFSKELRGLKIRSRVTEAVMAEAGSRDREVCKSYLQVVNLRIARRRADLEAKLARLEAERVEVTEERTSIQEEGLVFLREARAVNPGVEYHLNLWMY